MSTSKIVTLALDKFGNLFHGEAEPIPPVKQNEHSRQYDKLQQPEPKLSDLGYPGEGSDIAVDLSTGKAKEPSR